MAKPIVEAPMKGAKDGDVLLRIEDLHVDFDTYFGVVHALSGVNLNLYTGTITGLVGETGCGKSVTAKSIMRLISGRIVSGKIYLKKTNLLQLSEQEMQNIRGETIAMVFQNPRAALNPVFKIEDQMHLIFSRHQKLSRIESREKTIELLRAVGIAAPEKRLKNYPFEMSTGMCQRIMIAMALSCRPKLLLADEPTTGLDVTIQTQILDLFSQVVHEFGATAMMITHALGVVAETCDYMAVMYGGEVIESGWTEDVFEKPLHPYTQGLIKSSGATEEDKKMHYLPGSVPDLIHPPLGCSFASRCEHKVDRCSKSKPAPLSFEDGHMVKCFTIHGNSYKRPKADLQT